MRTAIRRSLLPAFLLLVAVLAGCGGQRGVRSDQPGAETTTIRVENNSFLDMTVYVIRNGQRTRLGLVNGSSTRTFVIPDRVVGFGENLSFLADPVGSSVTAQSFDMYVRPGDEVGITIPATVGR